MCVLYLASAQSAVPRVAQGWDKVIHAGAYGTLGFLSLRAFHGGVRRLRLTPTILGVLLTVAYGLVDEWHQTWVPGRHAGILDWVADLTGALCAVGIFGLLGVLRPHAEKPGSLKHHR